MHFKETHELEIRKLELQLELANISTNIPQPTGPDDSKRSMGHLKAPKKTRFPQPSPHIFAPGEPQLYSEFSLPAFCAGYIAILEQLQEQSSMPFFLISMTSWFSHARTSGQRFVHAITRCCGPFLGFDSH